MNQDNSRHIIVYSTPEGDVRVNAIVKDETIWLTQKGIAELFDVGVPAVSKHLKNFLPRVNCSRNWLFPKWKQPLSMALLMA